MVLPQVRGAAPTAELVTDTFASSASGITELSMRTAASKSSDLTGTISTSLETEVRTSIQPFATISNSYISSSTSNYTARATATMVQIPLQNTTAMAISVDPFLPVATTPPPSQITSRGDHPVARLNIVPQYKPKPTNKFYANLFLGLQGQGVWTHPYSISWSRGGGNARSWGLAVQHIDANQRAFGPANTELPGAPARYMINPLGIASIILSASELGSSTQLTTDSLETFSVNANLCPGGNCSSSIRFPLVQGMGFVTAVYQNLTPNVGSSVFFRNVAAAGSPRAGVYKYRVTLEDGNSWLLYVTPGNGLDPALSLRSNTLLVGPAGWSGTIQVAKNPAGNAGEAIYDASSAVYPTAANITGCVDLTMGTYSINWSKAGLTTGQSLLMFALPHLVASFDVATANAKTSITLATTTKGNAVAVAADHLTMVESALPVDMGFAPWTPGKGSAKSFSATAISAIMAAASSEVTQDMGAQTNLNSMYYSGKALSKFAQIVYTIHDIANQPDLAFQGLAQLKTAFARFATNQNIFPLVYDTAWGGVVSSASYVTHDNGADFGNTLYNDHHFHYGYFIHAAAIIGYLDPQWLDANRAYVNTLVRDVANPSSADNYFPVFRSFDWFHGHSWAKGLFESGDSKDEESSSEDVMFAFALKMWGATIRDTSMEARGNLMLAVLARSLHSYFLMDSANTIQPPNFIGNKVTGILFENKIDHVTYFGSNYEYIQGIHMIPLLPSSPLVRSTRFVSEEWQTYFAESAVDPASKVVGGWKGLLYANLAIIDPVTSFRFFSSNSFNSSWLDGGASRTWYLAFAAGLGGAPS